MARPFHVGLQTLWRLLSDAYVTRTRGGRSSLCRHAFFSSLSLILSPQRLYVVLMMMLMVRRRPLSEGSHRIAASGRATTLKPLLLLPRLDQPSMAFKHG